MSGNDRCVGSSGNRRSSAGVSVVTPAMLIGSVRTCSASPFATSPTIPRSGRSRSRSPKSRRIARAPAESPEATWMRAAPAGSAPRPRGSRPSAVAVAAVRPRRTGKLARVAAHCATRAPATSAKALIAPRTGGRSWCWVSRESAAASSAPRDPARREPAAPATAPRLCGPRPGGPPEGRR